MDRLDTSPATSEPLGVYLHLPFCASRCGYCDFATAAVDELPHRAYAEALLAELRCRAPRLAGAELRTVYVGGGTPSLWDPAQLARVLQGIRGALGRALEVTLEANPSSVSSRAAEAWLAAGVNRVSLGLQSLDDGILALLGRRHTAAEGRRAVATLRAAGVPSLNLDIIFGLPGQDPEHHQQQLEALLELSPDHVSAYALTLAPRSPMYGRGLRPAESDRQAEMMELGRQTLERAGLPQYEVSNFAPPPHRSQHNLLTWRGAPYLGLGAHAHSMARHGPGHRRWHNTGTAAYLAAWTDPAPPESPAAALAAGLATEELLGAEEARFELLFLGLRTREGLGAAAYRSRGAELAEELGPAALDLSRVGLVQLTDRALRPTARGIWHADALALRLWDNRCLTPPWAAPRMVE